MSARLTVLGLFVALVAMPVARAQEEKQVGEFLREDRLKAPADQNFREALPRTSAEAPLNANLMRDVEIIVRHAVYPMADSDKKIRDTPQMMSRIVDQAEGLIRLVFQSPES